jgi:hypothetical protein
VSIPGLFIITGMEWLLVHMITSSTTGLAIDPLHVQEKSVKLRKIVLQRCHVGGQVRGGAAGQAGQAMA